MTATRLSTSLRGLINSAALHLLVECTAAAWNDAPSPQRLAQLLRERREHDVNADADSFFRAHVRVDGVFQVGREHQKSAVGHSNYDLISVLRRKFHDRRPDNTGLTSGVMKVYGVRTGVSSNVIDATQKVVRVAMTFVNCTLGENRGPAASDFESFLTDLQESQNALGNIANARNEFLKFVALM